MLTANCSNRRFKLDNYGVSFFIFLLSRGRGLRDRRGARELAYGAVMQAALLLPRFPSTRVASSLGNSI